MGIMTVERAPEYLLVDVATLGAAPFFDDRLAGFTERHACELNIPSSVTVGQNIEQLAARAGVAGVVFSLDRGVPSRTLLRLCERLLRSRCNVYFYWPAEQAVEVIDPERVTSFWRLWFLSRVHGLVRRPRQTAAVSKRPILTAAQLDALAAQAEPVEFNLTSAPSPASQLERPGMYVRLDFWAPITSGGSYGHTVYQAKALSKTTNDFVCILGNRFQTLDTLDVRQVIVQPDQRSGTEANIIEANDFYYERLKPVFEAVRPAFIFERLVLGNYVVAKICGELGIPYIAEYNGSEISMARTFGGHAYEHEAFFLAVEGYCFKQATLISVVSEPVADTVARRGVDRSRILVNPNAVDVSVYAPAPCEEKQAIKAKLGFSPADRVIGFIGTFGGWHGIDVLAAAIPQILAQSPAAKFLLIGDGNMKHLVSEAVAANQLQDRVVDVGRVEQAEGAQLLKACDVLVSPHSSHMVDGKFFGSPTKLFEYMAMSAGIVASDLEQIGEVLTPALRPKDLSGGPVDVRDQRAVLCTPGNVDEFVKATLALVNNPALSDALGRNARAAAELYYTWDAHVADLWAALTRTERCGFHADLSRKSLGKAQ